MVCYRDVFFNRNYMQGLVISIIERLEINDFEQLVHSCCLNSVNTFCEIILRVPSCLRQL